MIRTTFAMTTSALLVVLLLAGNVHASVAYDNFPARVNQSAGYQVGAFGQPLACQFQSLTTGPVDRIDLALGTNPGGGSFTASLYQDSGNNLGTLLKSWSGVGTAGQFTSYASIFNSDSAITLTAGQLYWLQTSSSNDAFWSYPNPSASGRIAFNGSTFAGQPLSAFAISTVPEPGTLVLAAFAWLCGSNLIRRRGRK